MKTRNYTEYHKVWKQNYGKIPKDVDGRSLEIHHIDGNHQNNDITNLKLVTIGEHYEIHRNNEDWGACHAIAIRMNKSPDEISRLATLSNLEKSKNGKHQWQGDGSYQRDNANTRLAKGTHNFQNPELRAKINNLLNEQVRNGTHLFVNSEFKSKNTLAMLAKGTHPSQIKKTCEHCGITCGSAQHKQWHGDKCKMNPAKKDK